MKASLTSLRELFPDDSFEDRIYSSPTTRDTYHSYADFVDGTKLPFTNANEQTGGLPKRLKTLVRGRYPAVDKLLDWLVGSFCPLALKHDPHN